MGDSRQPSRTKAFPNPPDEHLYPTTAEGAGNGSQRDGEKGHCVGTRHASVPTGNTARGEALPRKGPPDHGLSPQSQNPGHLGCGMERVSREEWAPSRTVK